MSARLPKGGSVSVDRYRCRTGRRARLLAAALGTVLGLVGCSTGTSTLPATGEGTPFTITDLPTAQGDGSGSTGSSTSSGGGSGTGSGTGTGTGAGGSTVTDGQSGEITAGLPRLDRLTGPVERGTYLHVLQALGFEPDPPQLVLTLPPGWSVLPVGSLVREGEGVTISFWHVDHVFADSCRWHGQRLVPGPGIRDLAQTFQAVPGRGASEPVEVDIDGRWGLFLRWSVPLDQESDRPGSFVGCHDTRTGDTLYVSWGTWPSTRQRYHRYPGEVDRLWILDVDGRRLVIDAQQEPSATQESIAEIDAIIASIRFVG